MNLDYYELIVTNRAGTQVALFSSSAGTGGLLSCTFSLERDVGCKEMKFSINSASMNGSISIGNLVTFKAKVSGNALATYWHGVISTVPGSGDTGTVWEYEAMGLFEGEIAEQRIIKYYAGATTSSLVTSILADIDTPVTAVSTSTSEISISSPYTVADFEAEFDDAGECIKQLALLQQDVQYGVDQNGKLYFKDYDTTTQWTFVVGKQAGKISVKQDLDGVLNEVYVQSKTIVGGGMLTLTRSDATSKTNYGTRTKVVQFRNSKVLADVARYGDSVIARYKNPLSDVQAELPAISSFVFPRGKCRLLYSNGASVTYPILKMEYMLDKEQGLVGKMSVGDRIMPTLEDTAREVVRRIETNTGHLYSMTKIEHTEGEEFAQAALVDARENGLLNTFVDSIGNTKVWDPDQTARINVLDDSLIVDPTKATGCVAVSNGIPTGETLTSVRLGFHFDAQGRVNFRVEGDETKFFDNGAGSANPDWRVNGQNGLECFKSAGATLYYKETAATGFELPANHGWIAKFRDAGIAPTGAYARVIFGYVDTNNYNFVEIQRGATTITYRHAKIVAGVTTDLDYSGALSIADHVVGVQYFSGSGHQLKIWDGDMSTVLYTGAYQTISVPASSRTGLFQWWDATAGQTRAYCRWFEIEMPLSGHVYSGNVYISRKNAFDETEFTSGIYMEGGWHQGAYTVFQDVSLTGVASGETLRAWFRWVHPGRLKGWSLSW
jgi:hypothetical protein